MDFSTRLSGINYRVCGVYSPEPLGDVYCFKLNFKISTLAYLWSTSELQGIVCLAVNKAHCVLQWLVHISSLKRIGIKWKKRPAV